MSGASCEGCLTITWEIRNCSIILSEDAEGCMLDSPILKTETRESKALFKLRLWNENKQNFTFLLKGITGHQVFDQYEMSLVPLGGEISLKVGICKRFSIEKSEVLLNKLSFLPGDTLTVRCRVRNQELTTEDFITRSILQEVHLHWAVKELNLKSNFFHYQIFLEDCNMFFRITWTHNLPSTADYQILVEGLQNRCGCPFLVKCNLLSRDESDENVVGHIFSSFFDSICSNWTGYFTIYPKFRMLTDIKLDFQLIIATHNELPVPSSADSTKGAIDYETSSSFPGTLSNDLLILYREGTLGDVTLKTDDKSFSAHKNILSARSKVFRAMLESKQMKEGQSGTVDIDDIDSATLDRMLVFLYGESLGDISWEDVFKLYYAADKYEIDVLKRKCSKMLGFGLTMFNACDALVLADTHTDEELMRNTIDFVRDHDEVIASAEWEKLEDSNPRLAAKVTRDLYSFLKKGKK